MCVFLENQKLVQHYDNSVLVYEWFTVFLSLYKLVYFILYIFIFRISATTHRAPVAGGPEGS